jgi:hypothetical protein
MPLKRNRVLESGSEKEETHTQWTDSTPCAPLIHGVAGGGEVLLPQTTPLGGPSSSISWLKVQNSDHWPEKGKYILCGVCSARNKLEKYLYVQNVMWHCVLTWIRFKCQNCNVNLCFDPCLRVFHTKLQF